MFFIFTFIHLKYPHPRPQAAVASGTCCSVWKPHILHATFSKCTHLSLWNEPTDYLQHSWHFLAFLISVTSMSLCLLRHSSGGQSVGQGHLVRTHCHSGLWPSLHTVFNHEARPATSQYGQIPQTAHFTTAAQTAGIYSRWAHAVGARALMYVESHSHALAGVNSEPSRSRGSRSRGIV